jgi:hypothetical protein
MILILCIDVVLDVYVAAAAAVVVVVDGVVLLLFDVLTTIVRYREEPVFDNRHISYAHVAIDRCIRCQ